MAHSFALQSWERGLDKKHISGTSGGLLTPGERCTLSYKAAALAKGRRENRTQDALVRDEGCPSGGIKWTRILEGQNMPLQTWRLEEEWQEGALTMAAHV